MILGAYALAPSPLRYERIADDSSIASRLTHRPVASQTLAALSVGVMLARKTLLCAALAATFALDASAAPGSAKGKPTNKTVSGGKRTTPRVKKTVVTKAKKRGGSRVVRAKITGKKLKVAPLPGNRWPEPPEQPSDPFEGMPPLPNPTPDQATEDRFAISGEQLTTEHGKVFFEGKTKGNRMYLGPEGELGFYLVPEWFTGHDLSVECWGTFKGGALTVAAISGWDHELARATVNPPPGGEGRIKAIMPIGGLDVQSWFTLWIVDADGNVPGRFAIEQCIVERD